MTETEIAKPEETSAGRTSTPPSWGWLRWVWRNLTSMRTAVILLALLALAAIPGSLFPQRNVASDPAAVMQYTQDHPRLAPWLDRLGMFDVYASPWFAAVYVLLLVSMTGCVLPRSRRLWQSVRSAPPAAPRNLARMEDHQSWETADEPAQVLATATAHLRRKRFRVVTEGNEVRAERGYLREVGNLAFHLSLLALLVGIAAGKLIGFEGRVAIAEGGTFANDRSQYDAFTPSAWTDIDDLEPLSFRLEEFDVSYQTSGPNLGQPSEFAARVAYRSGSGEERSTTVKPNHPLNVNETKFFLTGNGYAPLVTVRDGRGEVVFTGPVLFLPLDGNYASDGVIKAPDAQPTQLAFEGLFLPTADVGPQGPYSRFPDALDPQLFLTAYTGDLGLGDGVPQSVFTLDKDQLTQVKVDGQPFSQALSVGETMRLPGGQGTLTFDGVSRFANFQVAYDPGKEITLVAAIVMLMGLTASLGIRRRRIWVRVTPADGGGSRIEVAGYSLTRREPPPAEIADLVTAIRGPVIDASTSKDSPA
ncbi:cytochrome c biogenesis protein ResB [Nocardioides sp. SOB77]|uniref:Cytochrome c biogenesis protein ResB n=1 Tax=Nocardioides oceani TaxID=3058369 RepID=A0ABT8FM01_9ACTN|nr:cytochrome c biogenesis protein ResB [Nocardioides oceani]MDN4175699.1 cytochrome c biogenesis protein ResB [Nocardioides oceani]